MVRNENGIRDSPKKRKYPLAYTEPILIDSDERCILNLNVLKPLNGFFIILYYDFVTKGNLLMSVKIFTFFPFICKIWVLVHINF